VIESMQRRQQQLIRQRKEEEKARAAERMKNNATSAAKVQNRNKQMSLNKAKQSSGNDEKIKPKQSHRQK
jgi:hypothetical protein